MSDDHQKEIIFTAKNAHSADFSCGVDFSAVAESSQTIYTSYYENIYREQFIFYCDLNTAECCLYFGDYDWEKCLVEASHCATSVIVKDAVTNKAVNLSAEEDAWLSAVYMTVQQILKFKKNGSKQ